MCVGAKQSFSHARNFVSTTYYKNLRVKEIRKEKSYIATNKTSSELCFEREKVKNKSKKQKKSKKETKLNEEKSL